MMLTLKKCKIIIEEYTEDKDEYANFCKANFIDVNDTTTKVSKKDLEQWLGFDLGDDDPLLD